MMKTKHLLLIILMCFLFAYCHGQDTINEPYIKYSFKIENIETYQQAKPHWDSIRYFFNDENDKFKYRLDLETFGLFVITLPKNITDEEIYQYFISIGLNITELNKTYYE